MVGDVCMGSSHPLRVSWRIQHKVTLWKWQLICWHYRSSPPPPHISTKQIPLHVPAACSFGQPALVSPFALPPPLPAVPGGTSAGHQPCHCHGPGLLATLLWLYQALLLLLLSIAAGWVSGSFCSSSPEIWLHLACGQSDYFCTEHLHL